MPGAIDTNGVYQYAEDDTQPTFSDLLNLLASSVSDALAAHYASLAARLSVLETDSGEITSGVLTPVSGVATVDAQSFRQIGQHVYWYASGTFTASSTVNGTTGDAPNITIATFTEGWTPAMDNRPATTAYLGRGLFAQAGTSGIRVLAANGTANIAAGDTWSLGGVYPVN